MKQELAVHRHELLEQEKVFTERQQSYKRIQALKKELRLAEEQFQELYADKPVEEKPKKKKERSMILRDGQWVELE